MESLNAVQVVVLFLTAASNFFGGAVYSLQAPFYPAEAESKGVSMTNVGIVLASYSLAAFVSCPIISGSIIPKFGAHKSLQLGILILGTSTILFGLLNRINEAETFMAASILLRIFEALGSNLTYISGCSVLSLMFPNSLGVAMGVIETMYVLGMTIGPPYGGMFYQVGSKLSMGWSFTLPFLVTGLALYALAPIVVFTVPCMGSNKKERKGEAEGCKVGLIAILKIPNVDVFYTALVAGEICLGFVVCTLERFLFNKLEMSKTGITVMFFIHGVFYTATASAWGWVCDKYGKPIFILLTGASLIILAFVFMGPAAFIPLSCSVWMTSLSLAGFGVGMAAVYISGFISMLKQATRYGYQESTALVSTVSSLFLSGIQLGGFIGPIIGGALYDNLGFEKETVFPVILFGIIFIQLIFVSKNDSEASGTNEHSNAKLETSLLLP